MLREITRFAAVAAWYPQYLTAHWTPVSETASRQLLLSAASHQLTVPPHRQVTYGGRAFAVAGASTCNSLP